MDFVEGRFLSNNIAFPNVTLSELEMNFTNVRFGGKWSPPHCLARHRVRDFSSNKKQTNKQINSIILGCYHHSVS